MKLTILKPLQHRSFRLLFAGQAISDLGDWVNIIALITLITYRWELGASALASLSVTLILPRVLLAPVAGVWVDRWPRRTVMVAADLVRAVVVLGLVWAPNLYSALALVFALGAFSVFFSPARQATIRSTVPKEDLLAANSLSQLSVQSSKVIGPAIGGLLVAASSTQTAFVLDAISFVLSAIILSRLPYMAPAARPVAGEKQHFWREFRAGLTYILQVRTLAVAVAGSAVAFFIIFTFDSLGALALRELGVGERLLGLAVGGVGLGTAVGAALIGQWGMRFHPLALMGSGMVATGIAVAGLGTAVMLQLSGTGPIWTLIWPAIGLAGAALFVPYGYVLQRETPPELMGRVASSADGIQTTLMLLAPPLGAALAELYGVGSVFVAAGMGLGLLGLIVLVVRPKMAAEPASGLQSTDTGMA